MMENMSLVKKRKIIKIKVQQIMMKRKRKRMKRVQIRGQE